MKLIYVTTTYGGRMCVSLQYRYQVYFEGTQPSDKTPILLDLPNLKSAQYQDILDWLKENSQTPTDSRREINEFPESCWRKAVLDDYIEAGNFQETVWQLHTHFTAEEFEEFGNKWLGLAQEKLRNALQSEAGSPRLRAFSEIKDFIERVLFVMDKTPYRLNLEIENIRQKLEEATFAEVKSQTNDLKKWIETAENFKSHWSIQIALNDIAAEIKNRRLSSPEILSLLEHFGENLRQMTYSTHPFWSNISPLLKFEQNLTGEEIDITNSTEEKVELHWDLIFSKRVGTVTIGRTALVDTYYEGFSSHKLYISGERKLKFQVQQKGGRLEKFGCTLTHESQAESKSIQPALLEVEKIDALANLNIEQALEKISHLNLPKNHLVFYTAEKAKTNPKQARVLADLLIELLVGVDADIARNLARSQSRGSRK